ncbi:hypothetical protein ACQEU3_24005 [Spirillospora sp. CA-253888]
MTESLAVRRPPAPEPIPSARRPSRIALLLLLGWAAQVAVRLVLAAGRAHPNLYPDESGYLIAARWMTGGTGTDYSGFTLYQGGYPLLLTPAYLLGDDPETVYRASLAINALIGAAVFPLAYAMLRRWGVRRLPAFPLAWAAALVPATSMFSGEVMADVLLPVLVLGWFVALDRFLLRRDALSGVLAALAACYAYATHSRGLVVVLVHALVLLACLVPRGRRRPTLVSLAVTAAGGAGAVALNRVVAENLYPYGARDLGSQVVDRLTSVDGLGWTVSGAVGQMWAALAGTWGLGAVGLVAVVAVAARRGASRHRRRMAVLLLVVTAGVTCASSAALPDEQRVGNFAYSRYPACLILIYLLAGLAMLVRGRSAGRAALAAAGVVAAGGLWVRVWGGSRLGAYPFYTSDLPEVGLLGLNFTELRPEIPSAVVAALLALWWALNRWGALKLFTVLLLVNLATTWLIITLRSLGRDEPPSVPGGPGTAVAIERPVRGTDRPKPQDIAPELELIYARAAYGIWWTRLERFDRDAGLPRPGICAAIVTWPAGILAADSWPQRPAGWRWKGGESSGIWWIVWYDPTCVRSR